MQTICPVCGRELQIGDWPMCESPGGHQPIRELNAKRFDPLVIWQSNTDPNHFSGFGARTDEACPEGYHKVEIRDLREADRFVSRINAIERAKVEEQRAAQYQMIDESIRQRRADTAARIGPNAKMQAMARAVADWADRRREKKRAQANRDPHFHSQVLSYDSGHRSGYSGPETRWRERKP